MKNTLYDREYFEKRDQLDFHMAESLKLFMKNNKLKKILDVGCGTGRLVKFFNDNGFDAKGCDLYEDAIQAARKINKRNTILKASATKLPFNKNSFDLITAISVIEHLTETQVHAFIKEAYRTIIPRGYIFIITPNFNSPMKYILKDKWFGYSDPTHITFFTPQTLSKLLRNNGLTQIKLWFDVPGNSIYSHNSFTLLTRFPNPLKRFLTYVFFSTPLSLLRDSFWIAAQKI